MRYERNMISFFFCSSDWANTFHPNWENESERSAPDAASPVHKIHNLIMYIHFCVAYWLLLDVDGVTTANCIFHWARARTAHSQMQITNLISHFVFCLTQHPVVGCCEFIVVMLMMLFCHGKTCCLTMKFSFSFADLLQFSWTESERQIETVRPQR